MVGSLRFDDNFLLIDSGAPVWAPVQTGIIE